MTRFNKILYCSIINIKKFDKGYVVSGRNGDYKVFSGRLCGGSRFDTWVDGPDFTGPVDSIAEALRCINSI